MKIYTLLLAIIIQLPLISNAQQKEYPLTAEQALKQEKIKTQFDYVLKKSGNYQDYKVIKKGWFQKLKKNTIDSLQTLESKLQATNQQITSQQTTISKLETNLSQTNENLVNVTQEKDNLNFLGMAMTKKSYKTLMWSIISGLLLLLIFFIFKFKNSNAITVQAKKSLAETEIEFEEHRRRALEREQKVMRKLQDEINKQRKASTKK